MRNHEPFSLISTHNSTALPLQETQISAEFHDLVSDVTLTQTFINPEPESIEAVYTFPLPIDAVLLGFSVSLNEKLLIGCVQEKQSAKNKYEDAIEEGDTAILLEQVEEGLYTVNIGHLLAGETAVIQLQLTQLHRWTEDTLRWRLPTVLAPRYGAPSIPLYQVPETDLTVVHVFSLSISIYGILQQARIESPSHKITQQTLTDRIVIELSDKSDVLDRDLIINFQLNGNKASAMSDRDYDQYIALASFCPSLPQMPKTTPDKRLYKLLVDCSGSMAGESIGQARVALLNILESLTENDEFILVRFGSTTCFDIAQPLKATGKNIKKARNHIVQMNADLGGTEIFEALGKTLELAKEHPQADLLLITDGAAWDSNRDKAGVQRLVECAHRTHQRIFTVGVGQSVSERLVRELADQTQGACELVHTLEDMADKIERHFKRMQMPKAQTLSVEWPIEPLWQSPVGHFFMGDTLHIFARFAEKPTGEVKLITHWRESEPVSQSIPVQSLDQDHEVSTLARLAAQKQMGFLEKKDEKIALAVKYQLMGSETAYLIVEHNPEELKPDGLPELRKVNVMHAAGSSGIGRIDSTPSFLLELPAFARRASADDFSAPDCSVCESSSLYDPPTVIKAQRYERLFKTSWLKTRLNVQSLDLLLEAGIADQMVEALQDIIRQFQSESKETESPINDDIEHQVIIAFLYFLSNTQLKDRLNAKQKKAINQAFQKITLQPEQIETIQSSLETIEEIER